MNRRSNTRATSNKGKHLLSQVFMLVVIFFMSFSACGRMFCKLLNQLLPNLGFRW